MTSPLRPLALRRLVSRRRERVEPTRALTRTDSPVDRASPAHTSTAARKPDPHRAQLHPQRLGASAPSVRERMQREGGPRDETLYSCGCGYDFTAAVVASVRCPRCDACLAW